jgi:2-oxoisovalerate dehydrogenase E2 component (dihydrolipoyl transacylase)
MARAALLRALAARHVAARAGPGACAAVGGTGVVERRASLAALPPPPTPPTPSPLLLSTHHHPPSRLFASLTTAPSSAASAAAAAAASPARAEEASDHPTGSGVVVSFPLAQTGEGISECELVRWHVSPGDSVEEFQPLCEVQSDKASIEITSRYAGTVAALHHGEGDVVKVGAALVDIRLPSGVGAPPGAVVVGGGGGGDDVVSEEVAQDIGGGGTSAAPVAAEVLAPPAVRRLARELGVDLAALAPGSGVGGRLTKEDVQAARDATTTKAAMPAAVTAPPPPPPPPPPPAAPPVPAAPPAPLAATQTTTPPQFDRIPIRGYARTMLRTSTEALSVPMFYYFDEVRVDALARLRAELSSSRGGGGGGAGAPTTRLTFLPFIVKALSVALAQHPAANASLELPSSDSNQQQPSILRYKEHNVGVAMATPGGLVVPVVRNVERKTVAEVAAELAALQQGAAEGKLPPEALSGGTITVSNIGALGGTHATPLAHPPQAAIVALGRARALPRFAVERGDGASSSSSSPPPRVESHLLMDVSWGADHRVVDGAEVARLSNCWRALLEEPSRLLLHLR